MQLFQIGAFQSIKRFAYNWKIQTCDTRKYTMRKVIWFYKILQLQHGIGSAMFLCAKKRKKMNEQVGKLYWL